MTVRLIDVNDYFDEATPLFEKNWRETGFDFELSLDKDLLVSLQETGKWFCMGGFNGRDLVGYVSAVICPHHFNKSITFCATDALFVDADLRKKGFGAQLIIALEKEAKKRGANFVLWHTRAGTALAEAFEKRGYTYADHVMMGRI